MSNTDDPLPTDHVENDDEIIGHALRWSLIVLMFLAATGAAVAWWVNRPVELPPDVEAKQVLPQVRDNPQAEVPALPFTDITEIAGIKFVHQNGATGQKLLPETMGGGCAFLDYDGDGDQDLLLVNSNVWPWDEPSGEAVSTTALYANDGAGQFSDVSIEAGLDITCYGMGVAVGDYDNDGDPDLFLSAVGKNLLLRNEGGHFFDDTESAGVAGDLNAWSTSCGWFDFDNDGDLDLLVGNYVQWSKEIDLAQDFRLTGIGRAYGPPFSFEGSFPYLYRNEGDGRFVDVSADSGIQKTNLATGVPLAKTLGVALIDADRDGWMDFILANDTVQNLLFVNQRDGTFQEQGVESGIAFDGSGKARGAMGIDVGCFRNDDCLGIAIANFANEMTALYVSAGDTLVFTDDAIPTGLGPPTRSDLSFGLFFLDADLDGRLDLFSANGHIENDIHLVQKSQRYRQPSRLFWNAGPEAADEFVKVPSSQQSGLSLPLVARGAAYADIDADGDLDIVVTQIADRPVLLRNDQQTGNHFVRLKLEGASCNRDAIGAWVELRQGERVMKRQVMPTRGYLSQVELPVTIGLGSDENYDSIVVRWPDGSSQVVDDAKTDANTKVIQQLAE